MIIDMDPQGHVAPGLGIDFGYNDRSVADVIADQEDISSVIIPTPVEGLDLVPSNIRLAKVRESLYNTFKRERRLIKAMESVLQEEPYDLVFIDCPPSLGPLVENALIATDYCLIPCEPSSRSIDGLADFVDRIHEIREGELDNRWHIILSRVKKAAKVTNEIIEEKLSGYRDRILSTRVFERESINQAQIAGIPVYDFPRGQSATENLTKLGEEVSRICQIEQEN